jgi:histidinol dehydrogenase
MGILTRVTASSRRGRKSLERLVARADEVVDAKTRREAARIVESIRVQGDRALLEATRKLDGVRVKSAAELRLAVAPVQATSRELPVGFAEGLERAIAAVERYHQKQVRAGFRLEESGMTVEERREPLRRVGIYVPGGRASYPSTVVMTVVPARLAGVKEIVIATPRSSFERSAALRYTLHRLGIEEVWGIGGAQAIAALAYGTETVRRVDKIVGPGNPWVTAAKQLVSGRVAVDGVAGPSEVVIFATDGAPADLVAADLLAQAEHDPRAAAILVTTSKPLGRAVDAELQGQLHALPADSPARDSLKRFGFAFLVDDLEEGLEVVDTIAPEHLQLVGKEAESLSSRSIRAGAIFVGSATPEVFGDYIAGPSHVLPTCGSARYASALGVDDFVRRYHLVRCAPGAASRWAAAAVAMAEAEGLPAHAAAAVKRLR